MVTEQYTVKEQLLDACIEALSLYDDYPDCYNSIGTYEVLRDAIKRAMEERNANAS